MRASRSDTNITRLKGLALGYYTCVYFGTCKGSITNYGSASNLRQGNPSPTSPCSLSDWPKEVLVPSQSYMLHTHEPKTLTPQASS